MCVCLCVSVCGCVTLLPVCSLQEECEVSLCPPALSSKNQDLQRDLTRVTAIFLKLQSYITLLALPCKSLCSRSILPCPVSLYALDLYQPALQVCLLYFSLVSL